MKRLAVVVPLVLAVLGGMTSLAEAHPAYKSSSPAANSSVAQPPSEVWVEFTEAIEDGTITVIDPCGDQADHGDEEMNLTMDRLTKGTHGDKAGTYTVQWSVLGSDGHSTRGEFTFTSSGGADCPGTKEPDPVAPPKKDRDPRTPVVQKDVEDDGTSVDNKTDRPKDGSDHKRKQHHNNKSNDRVKGKRVVDIAQPSPPTDETAAKSIWDGIPLGDFLMALTVAALIGAAGGRIYAGIIGPRR
jgi:copper resistance protein C